MKLRIVSSQSRAGVLAEIDRRHQWNESGFISLPDWWRWFYAAMPGREAGKLEPYRVVDGDLVWINQIGLWWSGQWWDCSDDPELFLLQEIFLKQNGFDV